MFLFVGIRGAENDVLNFEYITGQDIILTLANVLKSFLY